MFVPLVSGVANSTGSLPAKPMPFAQKFAQQTVPTKTWAVVADSVCFGVAEAPAFNMDNYIQQANTCSGQWKVLRQQTDPDLPRAYFDLIPEYEPNPPEIGGDTGATGYLPELNRNFISKRVAQQSEPLILVPHENWHALCHVQVSHLLQHNSTRYKEVSQDSVLQWISHGNPLPKLVAGMSPQDDIPGFEVPKQLAPVIDNWIVGVFDEILGKTGYVDQNTLTLTPMGIQALTQQLPSPVRSVFETCAGKDKVDAAAVETIQFVLKSSQKAKPIVIQKPYLPRPFRPAFLHYTQQMLAHPEPFIQYSFWQSPQLSDTGKRLFLDLLDADTPASDAFIQQFENRQTAEQALLGYAQAVFYTYHQLIESSKINLPEKLEKALTELPLPPPIQHRAEAVLKAKATVWTGQFVMEASSGFDYDAWLSYELISPEEREARASVYHYLLHSGSRLQAGTEAGGIKANLDMVGLLDEYVQLLAQIDLAERDPLKIKVHNTDKKQIPALEAEFFNLHRQVYSAAKADPQRPGYIEKRDEVVGRLARLYAQHHPLQELTDTTENRKLKEHYGQLIQRIQTLLPQCTADICSDFQALRFLGTPV